MGVLARRGPVADRFAGRSRLTWGLGFRAVRDGNAPVLGCSRRRESALSWFSVSGDARRYSARRISATGRRAPIRAGIAVTAATVIRAAGITASSQVSGGVAWLSCPPASW